MLRLAALSQYPVVTRSIPGVGKFLFRDEFVTPLAAGQVHGTLCEPGPGRLIVVDTGGALAISGGALQVGRGSAGDPGVSFGALRRRAGQVLALALNASDLTSLSAGYAEELAVGLGIDVAGGDLRPVCNGAVGPTVATLSVDTDYVVYLLPRTLGSFLFLQGAGHPELLWVDDTDETTIRLARILGNRAVFACDWIRVPQALWLPAPLLYDRFQRADGGLGSSDGYAGDHGLGAVASAPWDRKAGWTVASSRAQNTPPESGQLLTDGGLEEWTTATNLTSWNEIISGGNSVNQEASVVRSGTYACRIDVVDPARAAHIRQTLTIPAGTWTRLRAYVRASSEVGRVLITINNVPANQNIIPSTTEWTLLDAVIPALVDNPWLSFGRRGGSGVCSLYLDDLQVDTFATPDLFATQDVGTADVLVGVRLDANPGDHAVGAALCLDDPDDPQNYLVVFRYLADRWRLIKCVAGVPTVVATSGHTTFAAGAWLWVAKGGDQVTVWYNGKLVIPPQTVSDAEIVDNTRHGMFAASDVPGLFGGCEIWARGTDGEYQILETLTAPVPEENLVLNPSFEAGAEDTFTSWSKSGVGEGYPGNLIEQDLTDYSDGQRAAKITRGATTLPALYQYVPVTVGASYEVSFWGHSSAVGGIGFRVAGCIGGTEATNLVPRTTFGLGDSVWRRYARTFTVPPNYTQVRINVSSAINPGIAWIDNVRLRRIA